MYDFPQKFFSIGDGTYSPIPDPSKNWSVKRIREFGGLQGGSGQTPQHGLNGPKFPVSELCVHNFL